MNSSQHEISLISIVPIFFINHISTRAFNKLSFKNNRHLNGKKNLHGIQKVMRNVQYKLITCCSQKKSSDNHHNEDMIAIIQANSSFLR